MDKTELLATLGAGHDRLRATIDALTDDDLGQPALGDWTRRDLVAHVEWWERHSAHVVEALRAGREPYPRDGHFDLDALNARTFEESRGRAAEDVRRGEADAWAQLLALLEGTSDADLFEPDRFAWLDGEPLAALVRGDTDQHWDEHLPHLAGPSATGA